MQGNRPARTLKGKQGENLRKRKREPLPSAAEREKMARNILASTSDMVIAVDLDRKIIEFNRAAERIFGYSEREVLGKPVDILYSDPAQGELVHETVCLQGEFSGEIENRCKNGRIFSTFISASPLYADGGQVIGTIGFSRDITDFKMAGEALKQSETFLTTIFDSIKDPFSIIDREFRIVRANEAYAQLRNKKIDEVVGEKCYMIFQDRSQVCEDCVVKKTFNSSDPCAKDKQLVSAHGSNVWIEIYTYPILDESGEVSHVIEYTRDITDRKKSEEERKKLIEKLEYLSSTDVLTGLLNRRALIGRLIVEAERAKRYGSEFSLILCDIDRFKEINDEFGHITGDGVLQMVSEVLKKSLRSSDIVGRYGGDEFMVLLPQTSLQGAREFAERIRSSVEGTDYAGGGVTVGVSLSLGVTNFESAIEDVSINGLIKRADMALYTSKKTGRNKVSVIPGP